MNLRLRTVISQRDRRYFILYPDFSEATLREVMVFFTHSRRRAKYCGILIPTLRNESFERKKTDDFGMLFPYYELFKGGRGGLALQSNSIRK